MWRPSYSVADGNASKAAVSTTCLLGLRAIRVSRSTKACARRALVSVLSRFRSTRKPTGSAMNSALDIAVPPHLGLDLLQGLREFRHAPERAVLCLLDQALE